MEKKIYLYLRYIIIFSMLLGVTFSVSGEFETLIIILISLFIINNQLRYFREKNIDLVVFISIFLEWMLGYVLYVNYGGVLISYFIIGFLDSLFLINKNSLRYSSVICGMCTFFYTGRALPLIEFSSYAISVISLVFISAIIQLEYGKKEKVEELYNKLKLSEHQLIQKNSELKEYSKSLKELTLLKERNRISREIHDSVGHSLSTIIIQLGAIEKITHIDGKKASDMTSNLREFSKTGLEEIRNVLKELKPKDYSEYEVVLGIEELVNNFVELTDVAVNITCSRDKYTVKEEVSFVLYRAVQEFLSNSIKHGEATKINIFLNFEEDELIISMKDNGVGTDEIHIGMGLMSLKERVAEVKGTVSFESQALKGFFTRISFKGVKYGED